jgi:transcriptional regulator with XRE-family HTH domain
MSVDQAIERVRLFRIAKGWTVNKFATEAGVTESTLRKIDDDDWNPERKTLLKLERVMAKNPIEITPQSAAQ